MDWPLVAIEVLFTGTAVALGVWQLVALRRDRSNPGQRSGRPSGEDRPASGVSSSRMSSPERAPSEPRRTGAAGDGGRSAPAGQSPSNSAVER
ncbi:hypothetical protein J2S22_000693 [Rhodoplanes tepidamans]|nr:hypothetical protein [Rhodoplanes tepidamans]